MHSIVHMFDITGRTFVLGGHCLAVSRGGAEVRIVTDPRKSVCYVNQGDPLKGRITIIYMQLLRLHSLKERVVSAWSWLVGVGTYD